MWVSSFWASGFWVDGFWEGEIVGPGLFAGPGWIQTTLQYRGASVQALIGPAMVDATPQYRTVSVVLPQETPSV